MRSMLVIGLGRFGRHLAVKLAQLGNEVMVIDRDEASVSAIAPLVTSAQSGDCTNETVIRSIGINNFDVCFVCISDDFQSSLEITSLLRESGAKYVVAKADRDIHAKFLLRNGADDVIYPERDMAQRTAIKYNSAGAFDYIELTDEYAILEIGTPCAWAGKSIAELSVRTNYKVNVIGFKRNGIITPMTDAKHIFSSDQHLIVAGSRRDILQLLDKKREWSYTAR